MKLFTPQHRLDRTLLAGILTAGLLLFVSGCSSYSGKSDYEKEKEKRKSFSTLIEDAGGTSVRKGHNMFGFQVDGWTIVLAGADISDDLVEALGVVGAKEYVVELDLSKSSITDDQLGKLSDLKVGRGTVNLDLSDTAISDAGLDKMGGFHALMQLNLKGSKATKEGGNRLIKRQQNDPDAPPPFKKGPKIQY